MNIYAKLGIVLAVVLALGAAVAYVDRAGRAAERAKWQQREIEQARAWEARVTQIRKEKDAAVAALQGKLVDAQAAFEKKREEAAHAQAENARTARDLHDGRLVLRDPGRPEPPGRGEGASGPGPVPSGDGGAQGGSQLSSFTAEFLWSEASRADALVGDLENQLKLAQDNVTAYYRLALACR